MRRREMIAGLGSAAVAWPLSAHTQPLTLPVVGFLGTSSLERMGSSWVLDFKRALAETGYVEDRNVAIEIPVCRRPI
jgi:putative tryptophan/tyrosine transport system substrate-binding protein